MQNDAEYEIVYKCRYCMCKRVALEIKSIGCMMCEKFVKQFICMGVKIGKKEQCTEENLQQV